VQAVSSDSTPKPPINPAAFECPHRFTLKEIRCFCALAFGGNATTLSGWSFPRQ
jgi:hypothetical protein